MKTLIKINSIFGKLLFEYEKEDNTLKDTLLEGLKQGANLRSADLYDADLRSANLRSADLYDADLRGANLRGADLRGADLRSANLRDADLRGADLRSADLYDADLRSANLYDADLYDANLRGADLRGADLRDADLRGADLSGADLRSANLRGADLSGAKNTSKAYLPLYNKWNISFLGNKIQIGCKEKTIEEWVDWFNGSEEFSTKRGTEDFKRIQASFLAYKVYYEFMNVEN